MKLTTKYTLLLIGLLFFIQNAQSQDDRDFRVGFKIIPGFDWVKTKTNNIQKDGMGIGFSFGVMADIRLADNYFFTPEINVTSMSNRSKLKPDSVFTAVGNGLDYNNINYKYNLKYIEIPLTFKFRTKETNGMRYWGQIGIAPGFIISNNTTILASPVGHNTAFPTDEKYAPNDEQFDRFDFTTYRDNINVLRASMILGAGIEYNLSGNTSFYTGLRFNNGFTDILDDKNSNAINNVFGIEIGMFF
jgi:hypothetical protein